MLSRKLRRLKNYDGTNDPEKAEQCNDDVLSVCHKDLVVFTLTKAWNQLPAHLRALETIAPFKTALKTYLYSTQ